MFHGSPSSAAYAAVNRTRALEIWREAASLVSIRWQVFLEAEPESRAWAFAAYSAALDVEEAAATEVAEHSASIAA
jgi:hypothetical protein